MGYKAYIDGNTAVAYGVMAAEARVVAAYPITPQTKIVEKLAEFISDGKMDAEFIKVESEHSAMSACFGTVSTGVRAYTASSSQGILYMQEMLHYVSGARLPVVMTVVNRAVAPPWNIWCDHQDTISARDTGWIQIYVENGQEALDATIQAFRIAEDRRVLTPVMVCLDAFVLSHTEEMIEIPEIHEAKAFLPPLELPHILDVNNPKTMAAGATPDYTMEYRYYQQKGIENARHVILEVQAEFSKIFGRSYGGLIERYGCEDAEAVLIVLGSVSGTAKDVVDKLRREGKKVGLARVRVLRPFPKEELRNLGAGVKALGILDRNISFGYEGAVFSEVKSALYGQLSPRILNFIAGLGGRDITREDIRAMFSILLDSERDQQPEQIYIGLRCLND